MCLGILLRIWSFLIDHSLPSFIKSSNYFLFFFVRSCTTDKLEHSLIYVDYVRFPFSCLLSWLLCVLVTSLSNHIFPVLLIWKCPHHLVLLHRKFWVYSIFYWYHLPFYLMRCVCCFTNYMHYDIFWSYPFYPSPVHPFLLISFFTLSPTFFPAFSLLTNFPTVKVSCLIPAH